MKILFVIPSFATGGQEKAGMELCNFLMQHHDVTAVCFEPESVHDFNYKCRIERLTVPTGNGIIDKGLAGVKRIRALKKLKKTLAIDISIAFGNTAIILNAMSNAGDKKIASIRQAFHIIRRNASLSMKMHLALYVWAIKKADSIIPVSQEINTELQEYYHIHNTLFINNGVDTQKIKQLSLESMPFMGNGKRWLIHAGRFNESKGHWHLIKIFVELKKQFPDLGLALLGTDDLRAADGSIAKYCMKYLDQHDISWTNKEEPGKEVLFASHQENPFKYLSKATIFIFPSLWEGFPNALVEAMSCGVPAVAANCKTGPAEILAEGNKEYGMLLPAFDDYFDPAVTTINDQEKYWVKQISALLSDEKKLNYYRQQSLERSSQYSIEAMGHKWLAVLDGLIA